MERYYTFWRRLVAGLIDTIVLLIFSLLLYKFTYLNSQNSIFAFLVIIWLFETAYNVLLTGLVGQTIGKVLMGIKVMDVDEKNVIGVQKAIYRNCVPIIMQLPALLLLGLNIAGGFNISNGVYEISETIVKNTDFWWFILELVTMLLNPRRRAVHDLMASSVVISVKGLAMDKLDDELKTKRLIT